MSAPRKIGRYAVYGEIGVGGMATVYFGRLAGVGGFSRVVAIKQLHPHLARSQKFVTAFLDEARLAARVRHTNVMPTLDVIQEDNEILIIMEYVSGVTMTELGKAPAKIAAGLVHGVLEGLHAAHIATDESGEPLGIVHRDMSPHNVLVGVDGIPRVLDFGVAKAERTMHTTSPGEVKGKLAYMAPEQVMLEEASPRVDVFAAGAVLWEALTGRPLFEATNQVALLAKMLNDPILPPSLKADVPHALDAVVLKALNRNADARYATAQEFARAIERAITLATPREIAAFVEERGGDILRERAAQLKAVEREAADETHDGGKIPERKPAPKAAKPDPRAVSVTSYTLSEAFENSFLPVDPSELKTHVVGAGRSGTHQTPTVQELAPRSVPRAPSSRPPPPGGQTEVTKLLVDPEAEADEAQPAEMMIEPHYQDFPTASRPVVVRPLPPGATPTNAFVETVPISPPRSSRAMFLVFGMGVLIGCVIYVGIANPFHPATPPTDIVRPPDSVQAFPPAPTFTIAPTITTIAAPAPTPSPTVADPTPIPPIVASTHQPPSAPPPAPKPRKPPAPAPNPCNPNHYFDDQGIKHLKRECL